jgi:lipooligosaccharide transport system ATP-binding protein
MLHSIHATTFLSHLITGWPCPPGPWLGGRVINARALAKSYGDFTAVDAIDFAVEQGESFGILGPNGAGKSTTMRMIGATLLRTSGDLTILGKDPSVDGPEIRAHLGVVPQQDNNDTELTVAENLYIYGRYFGLPRSYLTPKIDELLDFAQLQDKRDAKVDSLSGGMKRRLTIARGLVNDPEIVMLDEPTTGLDPQARHVLWDRLFRLKEDGATLVITTHYMDEAEQLCDRLVVMDRGRIVAEGTPASLIRQYAAREVVEVRFGSGRNAEIAPAIQDIGERMEVLPDRILLYADAGEAALQAIVARGFMPLTSLVRRSSLEDVFLRLTGRTLEDE